MPPANSGAVRASKRRTAPLKRTLSFALLLPLFTVSLCACVVYPGYAGYDVAVAPPPPAVVEVPPPRHGFIWAPGYWGWDGHHHVWRDGRWLQAREGQHWIPDRWTPREGGHWHYERGHWEHQEHRH